MPIQEAENDLCSICMVEITEDAEGPDERAQFLACGHRFHVICIKTYTRVAGTTIDDTGCPNCSLNASDIQNRADSLMADARGPYDGDPLCGPIDAENSNQRAFLWKLEKLERANGKVTETWSWKPA